jgi:recombinational DNA repair protein (RecF pathway)
VIKPFLIKVVPCGFGSTHKARPGEGYNAPGLWILPKGEGSVTGHFPACSLGDKSIDGYNAYATTERSYRIEAVVLRHSDWGSRPLAVAVFPRNGKPRHSQRGKEMRSRKAGHLEPFTRVSLQLARARDLPIVTQAEALDVYLTLRENLLRVGYAAYVTELLDRFTYEEDENQILYRLLTDTLARLNTELPPALVVRYYEIRLLDSLGYRPQLFYCAKCEKEINRKTNTFHPPGWCFMPYVRPRFTGSCISPAAGAQSLAAFSTQPFYGSHPPAFIPRSRSPTRNADAELFYLYPGKRLELACFHQACESQLKSLSTSASKPIQS